MVWASALLAAAVLAPAASVRACDICSIYTATEMRESRTGFRIGVAEQFSRFATLNDDGEEIDNPGERVNSSITQLSLGYDVVPRFGLQFTLPVITRDYRRLEEGVLAHGDETGIGDVSLIAIVRPFSRVTEESVLRFSIIGGLEFPTGDSERLAEELAEDHHGAEDDGNHADDGHEGEDAHDERDGRGVSRAHHEGHDHDEELTSGVHGHDLALGSGSVDGVIGGAFFGSWRRLFATAAIQYAMRTEGDFDYRYANDLTWSGGPGVFALLGHAPDYSLAVQALVTGEYKGEDSVDGRDLDDSAITALYLGPGLSVTWGTSLAADVAADLPIVQNNSGVQLVPDYRVRGGVTWRF